jgi:hypothetical protein
MSDIDRIFARLGGGQPASIEQRELRHVPRRGGSTGSRVVQVVRLPARTAADSRNASQRTDLRVRAETWEDGFPAKSAPSPSPSLQPVVAGTVDPPVDEPVTHVMPMWERRAREPETMPSATTPAQAAPTPAPKRVRRNAGGTSRRVADPYDTNDDGSNCMRCGYLIQPARERRGLLTCAECG